MQVNETHGLSSEDVADEMLHAVEVRDAEKFARLYGRDAVGIGEVLDMLRNNQDDGFVAELRGLASENERLAGVLDMLSQRRLEEAAESGDVDGFVEAFGKSGFEIDDLEELLEDAELAFANRLRQHFPEGELDEWLSGMVGELLEGLVALGDAKSFVEAFGEYPVFLEREGREEVACLLEDADRSFLDEVRKQPELKKILEEYAGD